MVSFNCEGLRKQNSAIQILFILKNYYDIIFLTETWLGETDSPEIENYYTSHCPRLTQHKDVKRGSGGNICFINQNIVM